MYSDLATECVTGQWNESAGFSERVERFGGILVRTVQITDEATGKAIGKAPGTYSTVEAPVSGTSAKISYLLAEKLRGAVLQKMRLSAAPKRGGKLPLVLVVGLGNEHLSCDALGAMTVAKCFVGRGARARVVTLKPGVEGVTGLPAAEVVFSLIARIRPDAVVLVDALVASRFFHIGRTFQLSDAGIIPGSGTGNRVYEISEKTTGVPCFALGVPLAVSCETVARELYERRQQEEAPLKTANCTSPDGQKRSGTGEECYRSGAENCDEREASRLKEGRAGAEIVSEARDDKKDGGENGEARDDEKGREGDRENGRGDDGRNSGKGAGGSGDECMGGAVAEDRGGRDLVADFSRYIVCPREVDLIALRSANILAQAIDRAFL